MFGVGLAFVYPPATAVSRQYFADQHGLANGIVVSGGALGGCVLPYAVSKMLALHGLASTFRILGYLAIGLLMPSVFLLRPKRTLAVSSIAKRTLVDLSLMRDGRFIGLMVGCTIAMGEFVRQNALENCNF